MERTKSVKEKNEWTVMVFLAGDNNLSEECVWSLKEIFRAGVNNKIGVVVQIDPRASRMYRFDVAGVLRKAQPAASVSVHGKRGGKPKLMRKEGHFGKQSAEVEYLVRNDETDGKLLSRGRGLGRGRDRLSVKALKEFIIESKKLHKAHRYLLVLSGHSSGLIGNSFLMDGFPAGALSLRGLRNAIKAAGGVDVVGMDSCAMGTAEVGHQLRDCAKYLVSSEGFEVNTGWPYFQIITALINNPAMEPRELAANIVATHTAYYTDYLMAGVSTDMSACDISKTDSLVAEVSRLAELLKGKLPPDEQSPGGNGSRHASTSHVENLPVNQRVVADAIILAHWRSQSYRFEEHTDLYDFCELLRNGCKDEQVRDACDKVKKAIEGNMLQDGTRDAYVIKSCYSGGAFQHSHGVAIYFPWATFIEDYRKLSFSKDTAWDEFLRAYVRKTRRQPRRGRGSGQEVARVDETPVAIREAQTVGNREAQTVGNRGQKVIVPQVKNPPVIFFEDNCQVKAKDAPPRN